MIFAVAVTQDAGLDSIVDPRFGRARDFLIVDSETGATRLVPNTQNLNAAQGAGIQSAQNVVTEGAQAVITGHCGPKAFAVLMQAEIKIFLASKLTIKDALAKISAGELTPANSADVEGHWV